MEWVYLIPHTVDRSAGRCPEREALRFEKASLQYGQLAAATNRLAHLLRDLGVRRNDRVGIFLRKSLETGVAPYGIMKAGAAYVPLDPALPPSRLQWVMRHCGIQHLVTHPPMAPRVRKVLASGPSLNGLVGLDQEEVRECPAIPWKAVYDDPAGVPPDVGVMEQDLAYIMYTSGSTGEPKGIMHTHRSGLSYAEWAGSEFGLTPEDRLTNHAPLHFDLSTFDFFAGAWAGASTVVVPEACAMLPRGWT